MRALPLTILAAACARAPAPVAVAAKPAAGLSDSLLAGCDLEGLELLGAPEQAEGEGLFRLINGGAGVFLRAGFRRAVVQDYETAAGIVYTVELYEMGTPGGAGEVYAGKGGVEGGEAVVAEASTVEGYYGLFRQGRFFFTVTASDEVDDAKATVERMARAVAARLARRWPPGHSERRAAHSPRPCAPPPER